MSENTIKMADREIELPPVYQDHPDKEKLREDYKDMLFEPGEAIGVIAAQSISEPATQMSLDPDEEVFIRDSESGLVKRVEIGSFVDQILDEMPARDVNGSEVSRIGEEIEALTLDSKANLVWKPVREVSRHSPDRKLLKLDTKSGRTITATPHHSFVVREDAELKTVSGADLEPGDRIPVARNIDLEGSLESVDITEYFDSDRIATEVRERKEYIRVKGADSSYLPKNMELNRSTGWFAGMYLSDGHAMRDHVSITNNNSSIRRSIAEKAEELGLGYMEVSSSSGFNESTTVQINSSLLSDLYHRLFGSAAGDKRLPDWVLNAGSEFIQGLLRGYFDGDGNIHPDRKVIRASSNSEELVRDIAMLLSTQGILASITKTQKQWVLSVPYSYAKRFRERIGCEKQENSEKLERLVEMYREDMETGTQESLDMVAGFGQILKEICSDLGIPVRRVNSATKRGRIGRSTLKRYIELFRSKDPEPSVQKKISLLEQMADEDVFWDRIENIKRVEPTESSVYDLSVPGTETFVTSDGVVTHNTMETYHTAGAAKVSITQGLPRLIEVINARRNPKTPIMDVYLEEGNRSKEDAKEVAAQIRQIKLDDLISQDTLDLMELKLNFSLDLEVMEEYQIDKEEVISRLKDKLSKVNIDEDGEELSIYPSSDDYDLTDLQKVKKKAMDTTLQGIKGIEDVVILEEDGEWRVQTAGISLRKTLKIDKVDQERTVCNDLFKFKKVFGIEGARNLILKELQQILDDQGMQVDDRWLMLIADTMTKDGEINGATRYGICGSKDSTLARAAFEETKKHITGAAIGGEVDPLNSIVENIIVGQMIPVGTGSMDLKAKPAEAPEHIIEEREEKRKQLREEKRKREEAKKKEKEAQEEEAEEGEGVAESEGSVDYEELADNNIKDIKSRVEDSDLDLDRLLEAEKDNKDRKTLKKWIKTRLEDEDGS
ncbi:MAG: LAGLIDADG family homing endonuclease [Candidatus Nanohaloarchaea archaeon]|nr:LAGLIDADG family homing endonuclease [Candidatus Nanohaloarchaea archaeon]